MFLEGEDLHGPQDRELSPTEPFISQLGLVNKTISKLKNIQGQRNV